MTKINRRELLKLSASFPFLGLLPSVATAQTLPTKRMILVRAFGGWDVTYCLDPRLTSCTIHGPDFDQSNPRSCMGAGDQEVIESFGGLRIMTNAMRREVVGQFFQENAQNTVVVNGISIGSIVHQECEGRILTGSRALGVADMGTLTAVSNGGASTLPYLDLSGGARVGPYAAQTGMLGRNNQILALVDPSFSISGPPESGLVHPLYTPSAQSSEAIQSYLATRRSAWSSRDENSAKYTRMMADLDIAHARQKQLLEQSDLLKQNLTFGGGASLLDQNQTAVSLMKSGLCHSASLQTQGRWDTHDDITEQNGLYVELFTGLRDLVQKLKANDLFDETLVVVISEMTRTPKMNQDGGKDHWPVTSAMLIGGGLEGSRTLGGTTEDTLDAMPVNLTNGRVDMASSTKLEYANFAAGVLRAVGVDHTEYFPDTEALHGIVD